jgi:hypothetical protein
VSEKPSSRLDTADDGAYRRAEAVERTLIGDRVVLYQKTHGTAVVLNPTGSWLWDRLEAPQRTSDLVRALVEHYAGLSEDRARSDVSAFLAELSAHRLLSSTAK